MAAREPRQPFGRMIIFTTSVSESDADPDLNRTVELRPGFDENVRTRERFFTAKHRKTTIARIARNQLAGKFLRP
jgi:hypothetical protein